MKYWKITKKLLILVLWHAERHITKLKNFKMSDNNTMNEEINMALLNKKLDHMIDLFEKTMAILERRKTPKNEEEKTKNWSIEHYKNSLLVKFSYNIVFKDYIKELGGKWMVSKKSWMFPKSNTTFTKDIKDKFPDWVLTLEEVEEEVEIDS